MGRVKPINTSKKPINLPARALSSVWDVAGWISSGVRYDMDFRVPIRNAAGTVVPWRVREKEEGIINEEEGRRKKK